MPSRTQMRLGAVAIAGAVSLVSAASAIAVDLTSVPSANPKAPGLTSPNVLSPELSEHGVARGSMPVENPAALVANPDLGIDAPTAPVNVSHYGYYDDGPHLPVLPGLAEATKSEPDKNTYLVLPGQTGPDAGYDYGRRFLFQGHEHGPNGAGYVTRVNLDADGAHRVTLLASTDVDGKQLPAFDGSSWNPFVEKLLMTSEDGSDGGVWELTASYPGKAEDVSGFLGRAGYEGVQTDDDGNVWLVEDVGGSSGYGDYAKARRPNSFVYRYVPRRRWDLTRGGELQVLQVLDAKGQPITFTDCGSAPSPVTTEYQDCVNGTIASDAMRELHAYGTGFRTRWVTIHTADPSDPASVEPFDANALAKKAEGTPLKRPENGVFRPGSRFKEFYFTETGDTNADSGANAEYGGWGGIFRLWQRSPSADRGWLSLAALGDAEHTALDNIAFLTGSQVVAVEDRGDTLHTQRNALDSAWVYDAASTPGTASPIRMIAEGRDSSATIDAALGAASAPGFQNDGDNEITGIHVSDGDASVHGLLGAARPRPFGVRSPWRVFWTQQHGDNVTFEVQSR